MTDRDFHRITMREREIIRCALDGMFHANSVEAHARQCFRDRAPVPGESWGCFYNALVMMLAARYGAIDAEDCMNRWEYDSQDPDAFIRHVYDVVLDREPGEGTDIPLTDDLDGDFS